MQARRLLQRRVIAELDKINTTQPLWIKLSADLPTGKGGSGGDASPPAFAYFNNARA
ncbi:hypothetical protein GCM10010873_33300 [Cypionkella aquatica]|uniref:Uncharacterized protein n=1 Tax=Cypionkella aquatica TaxID=1756042 RepID=A0AA37X5U3_9RHOB|nr:hypothetical protein GCM10010873_33300 [Cypionkella aquatica]